MASFEYESPLELAGLARRRLGDELATRLARVRVKQPFRARSGPLSYMLAAEQQLTIELFNDAGDRDSAHRVIGKVSKGDRSRRIGWYPLIESGKSGAWLKYTTSATFRQTAKTGAGLLLGADSKSGVEHFYYHRHRRNKYLGTAVAQDLADQKAAFSVSDVLSLSAAQAAGFVSRGKVRLSLKLSWADLLASGISRLARLATPPRAVEISLSATAGAVFDVTVDDRFKLVFLGRKDDRIHVALRKTHSSSHGLSVSAGLQVKFARPSDVREIVDQVVAGLLGVSPGRISTATKSLKRKASLEDLKPMERALLDGLLEHLGIDDDFESLVDAIDELDKLGKAVTRTIDDIARARIKAGFSYDYARLETGASICEAILSRPALKGLHRDLLAGRFNKLLAMDQGQAGGIEILRFLNQERIEIRETFGLSLGFGQWSVSGRERTVFRFTRQQDAARRFRYILLGSRRYDGKYFGPFESTRVEFKAEMPDFAPARSRPGARQFRLGFAVTYRDDRAWASRARLNALLDTCLLCGIAPEGDLDRLAGRVRTLFGRRKTRSVLTLRLSHDALLGFASWLAETPEEVFAPVLAGAMDYSERRKVLQSPHSRRFLYTALWREALLQDWQDPYRASRFALAVLRPLDTSLYRAELQSLRGRSRDPDTVFMLIRRNPDLLTDLRQMREAFAQLNDAWASDKPHEVLADVARHVHGFTNTRFKTRVTGALIGAYRYSEYAPPRGVNAALAIKAAKGEDVFTVGR